MLTFFQLCTFLSCVLWTAWAYAQAPPPGKSVAETTVSDSREGSNNQKDWHFIGHVEIDLDKKLVTRNGVKVHLTPTEYQLLVAFVTHPGKLLTQRWLLSRIWGPDYQEETNVRVHVGHLRRKLEEDPSNPRLILTEPGLGYRWAEDA